MKSDRSKPPAYTQSISVWPDGAVLFAVPLVEFIVQIPLVESPEKGFCMRSGCLCFILLEEFEWSAAEWCFLNKVVVIFPLICLQIPGNKELKFCPVLWVGRNSKRDTDLHRHKTSGSETRVSSSFILNTMPFCLFSAFHWKERSLHPPPHCFPTTSLLFSECFLLYHFNGEGVRKIYKGPLVSKGGEEPCKVLGELASPLSLPIS